jgi:glutaminyl-tRNA synthetase
MEDAPRKFFRLSQGREVRLRYAYLVTCTGVVKDENGEITEVHCEYDPATRGGTAPDGRKVKGTIHWVSAEHALDADVRLYDRLFSDEKPDSEDFIKSLNPDSLEVIKGCKVEPSLKNAEPGINYQFERIGYFCVDSKDSPNPDGCPVFNRTVSLRDSWAKIAKKMSGGSKKK